MLAALDVALGDRRSSSRPRCASTSMRTAPAPMTTGPTAFAAAADAVGHRAEPAAHGARGRRRRRRDQGERGWYVRLPTLHRAVRQSRHDHRLAGAACPSAVRRPTSASCGRRPRRSVTIDRIFVEASAFGTRARDTIAFVSSLGFIARALNVADSQTYGAELVASARIARTVSITANYTRLVTQQLTEDPNFADKALPRQPGHAVYARADCRAARVRSPRVGVARRQLAVARRFSIRRTS